ncbi:MAG: Dam family site-specific DNA-(adenine-N6)-methyltransferase [Melioribacteraceae bacterium]|nr:Dam family site-specific DNA-(adenine-N6)-methyltransferase [Melioribacteraceae bacterium]
MNKDELITPQVKPAIRWAGGKRWLIDRIDRSLLNISINNYHEVFLGGAAIFFHLKMQERINGKSFLSDINEELINFYQVLRDNYDGLVSYLKHYKNDKSFYYKLRSQSFQNKTERAAQFLYLNRTSFNGIYRVNRQGIYNVPYGFKDYSMLFDYNNLKNVSKLLVGAQIFSADFGSTLNNVEEGDLVFLDPPYTVAHGHNGFIKYNQNLFSWRDQERLANYIERINEKKAFFILSNAAHRSITTLFKDVGHRKVVDRYSVVGGKKAKRERIKEYIFTNITEI